jgi:hypothetical protein
VGNDGVDREMCIGEAFIAQSSIFKRLMPTVLLMYHYSSSSGVSSLSSNNDHRDDD